MFLRMYIKHNVETSTAAPRYTSAAIESAEIAASLWNKNTKVSMIKCKRLQVYTEYVAYDTDESK